MASFNFNNGIRGIVTGAIDLDTDSFKIMLLAAPLTETEKDTFDFRSDITNEVTGTGYTAGGTAIVLTVAAADGTNNDVEITAGAASWAASTITAQAAVIYKSRGGASSADDLLCHIDFGGSVASTNGTFTVTPSGSIKFQN